MEKAISNTKENYEEIRKLANDRGYTSDIGDYQSYIAGDEEMDSGLQTLKEDKSWEDGTWSNLGNGGKTVKQDGKDYSTFKTMTRLHSPSIIQKHRQTCRQHVHSRTSMIS